MAIGKDLTIRVRAEFGGESSELSKALKEVQAETEELTDDLKQMGAAASKAMDTIGFGAENQLSRLQRFSNGFQGLTGKVGSSIGAISAFGKSLGPWNQALELGGKVARFAAEGMEAYAKTSAQAAQQVRAVTSAFEGLKTAIMEGVGFIAMDLLKSGGAVQVDPGATGQAKKILEAYQRRKIGSLLTGEDETTDKWRVGAGAGTVDEARMLTWWDPLNKRLENDFEQAQKARERAKRAADEERALAKELADQAAARAFLRTAATSEGRNLDDVVGKPIGFSTSGVLGAKADSTMRDQFGRDAERAALDDVEQKRVAGLTESWNKRLGEVREKQAGQKNFLESAFGTIDEINAHDMSLKGLQITFGGLQTGVSSAMSAWISGSMSLGLAIKKGIGDALAGVASQMAVESIKHGAFALGSLAFGDFSGAAKHGAAAATFGAGAAAAAIAARKLGASVNAQIAAQKEAAGGGGDSAGGSRSSAGGSASAGGPSTQGSQIINHYTIVYGEHFYSEANRMRQLDAQRFIETAVNSYAEHS